VSADRVTVAAELDVERHAFSDRAAGQRTMQLLRGGPMSHKIGEYGGSTQATEPERMRLRLLAEGLDPLTRRWLTEIGVPRGARCLEVGAATGSISRWLARQVGPAGRVVAADIDVRFLDDMDLPNVEVRRFDVRSDALEPGAFELVFCRTLLLHLPEPRAALAKLAEALAPGGVLFAQEPDMCLAVAADPDHPDAEAFAEYHRKGFAHIRRTKLFDTQLGRTLPPIFRELGLVDVHADAIAQRIAGKSPVAEQLTLTQGVLGPRLVADGAVTQAELDAVLRCYADPGFEFLQGLQFAVRGRRAARA
jgi:SAM-dependent methyltransferase